MEKNSSKEKKTKFNSLADATGKIPYNMLNDYMFRIVLQENKEALRQIIAAVLHISPAKIFDLEVQNTIVPGQAPTDKEYRMDIYVVFNDNTSVDIELQIRDEENWEYRGLHYLCREFERNMQSGDLYSKDHAAYQIGFLDFTLFEDNDKFFSAYEMCDIENHYRFNRNFALFVINLNRIDDATDADKASGLQKWCRFFKASTYEELKKLAKEESLMETLANDIFKKNADFNIQKLCEDRDDYLRSEYYRKLEMKKLKADLKETKMDLIETQKDLSETQKENERLKALLEANGIALPQDE